MFYLIFFTFIFVLMMLGAFPVNLGYCLLLFGALITALAMPGGDAARE